MTAARRKKPDAASDILPFRRPAEPMQPGSAIMISADTVRRLATSGLGVQIMLNDDGSPVVRAWNELD